MKSPSDYIPHLDWEGLHEPCSFDGPFDRPVVIPNVAKIDVSRDENYNIVGIIHGYTTAKDTSKEENEAMCRRQEATLQLHYATVEIQQFLVTSIRRTAPASPGADTGFDLTSPFTAGSINLKTTAPSDPVRFSLREWYINAPPNNHYLHQRVDRKKTAIYEHKQAGRLAIDDRYELLQYAESNMTSLNINVGPYHFLLEYSPDSFAPMWSKKLMIEYRDDWGLIPDESTRLRIAEIAGYLLGRELILIGNTTLNRTGYVLASTYLSHWRPNIRHLCQQYPRHPLNLQESPEEFEKALVRGLNAYQNKGTVLPIAECLRRYWLSAELPQGLNIVLLASTLELLAKAWFRSHESKSHGTYMSHDAYRALLEPEIDTLARKLDASDGGRAILRRILSAYNLGSNDHTEIFFSELGFSLSEDDRKALRGRNKYIHGERIDIPEASKAWGWYVGLFTRAMLRVLELQ